MGATIIVAIHGSRANRAGSFSNGPLRSIRLLMPVGDDDRHIPRGVGMPRGRSTFTKRQKEHTRQQRQKDKAERRSQRKQEKPVEGSVDEMAELREHAAEQAALFDIGAQESDTPEESNHGGRVGE